MNQRKIKNIVILGARGFGREVLWTLRECNKIKKKYEVIGFIDDDKSLHGKIINELPVLGGIEWFSNKHSENIHCIVAIGDTKIRKEVVMRLENKKLKFETIIHPSVIHSKFIEIGVGTVIQAGVILTTDIKLGNHVHVNIDSTIGHDTIIDDFVTINPGVHVNGDTVIGEGANIGTGTAMKDKITIGKWSVVGAGTILLTDVPDKTLFVGVPGKLKKKLS